MQLRRVKKKINNQKRCSRKLPAVCYSVPTIIVFLFPNAAQSVKYLGFH